MNILLIGKFPPIEGGVSSQSYWLAHDLAKRGHRISVVTDARNVAENFRVHMRPDDWERCTAQYGQGSVEVHWADEPDGDQRPGRADNPTVTQLVSAARSLAEITDFDVIVSYYLQPYGVAGHLVAAETGLPHIVKTAGSDVGRLWKGPQHKPDFDKVFLAAAAIVTSSAVRDDLIDLGVDSRRISHSTAMTVPTEVFSPAGNVLNDVENLRLELHYFGIYGKISEKKGVFALLEAIAKLAAHGLPAGGLLMVQGTDDAERALSDKIRDLGIEDRIARVPFLPHWRVPEFIRRCFAVCSLEQDFPITFHRPLVAREILACGGCLIASTEILGKLPVPERLVDGFNCVAIEDTNNPAELAGMMAAMLRVPGQGLTMGRRARNYYLDLPVTTDWVAEFEGILEIAIGQSSAPTNDDADENVGALLIEMAENSLLEDRSAQAEACRLGRALIDIGGTTKALPAPDHFRLNVDGWAMDEEAFRDATPSLSPTVQIAAYQTDMASILAGVANGTVPEKLREGPSYVVIKADAGSALPRLFTVSGEIFAFLASCDGRARVADIMATHTVEIAEVEALFSANIISLQPAPALVES